MKKMIIVASLLTLFMSGCVVHDRHHGYRDGYHGKKSNGHGHGRFCPPGQAKKGNC
ncbi:vir-repressed protein [Advenella kashmirensis W13003]|uniref:Vir-repressed protein n=1 Tax=Advenella kashmirensis W13003 TaxID=1424334 RepID=V8QP52_9BURK|nr:hypothetical protein [Advenella kashmirensis]ETF01103.1 vir-repressed protein [Advenella kashmirensis W13003]